MQQGSGRKLHCLPDRGHVGGRYQGPRVDAKEQMVHGGVADGGDQGNISRGDPGPGGHFRKQLPKGRQDGFLQDRLMVAKGGLDPGDDVRAKLDLGIDGAGGGQQLPGPTVQQKAHHRGGANVEGGGVFMAPVGT